jgi:hypothetical protein
MRLLRFTLPLLVSLPLYASADMCDTVAKWGGSTVAQCRDNTAKVGGKIYDNWVVTQVAGKNPTTGKRGAYASISTPVSNFIGLKPERISILDMQCFLGERRMKLDSYGVISIISFKDMHLTFKVDNQPAFTETWELRPETHAYHAPASSILASRLRGASKLDVTWQYNTTQPPTGYSFLVSGFDKPFATLCK